MTQFIIDITISLTDDEFMSFDRLSKNMKMALGDCMRNCMNSKCQELLSTYVEEKDARNTRKVNTRTRKRTSKENVSNKTGKNRVVQKTRSSKRRDSKRTNPS